MDIAGRSAWLHHRLRWALLLVVAVGVVLPALTAGPLVQPAGAQGAGPDPGLATGITDDGQVELLYFGTETCPFCQQMEAYLLDLEARFGADLVVAKHEVAQPAARARWEAELTARGHTPSGVPTTILGQRVWIGYNDDIARDITSSVAALVATLDAPPDAPAVPEPPPEAAAGTTIDVPFVGEVELAGRNVVAITALIAFVDGFNPCSLWVLALLLAMVLNAGASRRRVAAVGVTFLTVTGLIYGLFIVGVFTVVGLLANIGLIGWVVGALALAFGAINIKDYFAYKQGLSLTIPDRFKPRIYRGGRAIRDHQRPLPAVLATTVVLAAGVALIEIPCTMGFPVVWTGLLQTQGIERDTTFMGLLGLYLLIYILDELVLFAVVVATMRITRFEERHGRFLKLVGGSLMVVLGVAMIAFRHLMDSLAGLLLLTAIAGLLVVAATSINRLRGGPSGPEGPGGPGGAGTPSASPRRGADQGAAGTGRGSATSGRPRR